MADTAAAKTDYTHSNEWENLHFAATADPMYWLMIKHFKITSFKMLFGISVLLYNLSNKKRA